MVGCLRQTICVVLPDETHRYPSPGIFSDAGHR